MIYEYNKLVRDNIPENIEKDKKRKVKWRVLKENDFRKELDRKLLEEVHEFIEAHETEELADVLEVLETIIQVENIKMEDVKFKQKEKRKKKGGFEKRIYLEKVEEKQNLEEEKELNKSWRKTI